MKQDVEKYWVCLQVNSPILHLMYHSQSHQHHWSRYCCRTSIYVLYYKCIRMQALMTMIVYKLLIQAMESSHIWLSIGWYVVLHGSRYPPLSISTLRFLTRCISCAYRKIFSLQRRQIGRYCKAHMVQFLSMMLSTLISIILRRELFHKLT